MNRFVKVAETKRPITKNWFSILPEKTKKEILEALEAWSGPTIVLAEAIKAELKLNITAKQIATRIRDAQKQGGK